jgi:tetratricopeptide (TPR) repeat protein
MRWTIEECFEAGKEEVALADYDEALELRRDVPRAYAQTLYSRALVYSHLASLPGEDYRARLLQALADYDEALPLLRDVPLAYAATLNNRANVYRDLATVAGEDRRARLLQALQDAAQAVRVFEEYEHAVYLPVARRALVSICEEIV